RRPRARRVHPGRPRPRRRGGGPVRRGDRRPAQRGLLGAVRRPPHPGDRARRGPARRHRRPGPGPARGRRGRAARPGGPPPRPRAGPAGRRETRGRRGTARAPAAVPAPPRRPGPQELQGGHPEVTGAETVVLREMRWWDIDPVLELERELFPEDAWSRGMFWSELAHARGPGATRRYVVAQEGDRIVGYAGLATSGAAQDGTPPAGQDAPPDGEGSGVGADIQTIAVTRDHWGTGLGTRLLTDLLRAATAFECSEVLLECRVDNVRAQKLYERFGFETIGVRR